MKMALYEKSLPCSTELQQKSECWIQTLKTIQIVFILTNSKLIQKFIFPFQIDFHFVNIKH